METRRNFIEGLFGFVGVCLTLGRCKAVSREVKRIGTECSKGYSPRLQAIIAKAGRCEPSSRKKYRDDYTLNPKTGLPELTDRNLNVMMEHQEADYDTDC